MPGRYLFRPLESGDYYLEFRPANSGRCLAGKLDAFSGACGCLENDDANEATDQHGYAVGGDHLANGVRTNALTLSANPPPPGGYRQVMNPRVITPVANDPTGDDFSNLTLDMGLTIQKSTISSSVWSDTNNNGIREAGEPALEGITVRLLDQYGAEATTVTNAAGEYQFTDVPGLDHQLEFVLPTGAENYVFAPQNQGADETLDSDVDPASGKTAVFNPVLPTA
ncbi:MAG: SdrD B-like domain-containing protein [Thiolinea sp.]